MRRFLLKHFVSLFSSHRPILKLEIVFKTPAAATRKTASGQYQESANNALGHCNKPRMIVTDYLIVLQCISQTM